jgi:Flp pilus assembly secretin CpaC
MNILARASIMENKAMQLSQTALKYFSFSKKLSIFTTSLLIGLLSATHNIQAADQISVLLDRAQLFKMPESAKTLVIGNPAMADVSIIKNGLMVVTGKSYGLTNVIALDGQGRQISDTMIQVTAPKDEMITVSRGMEAETYHCAPTCNPTLMLGDSDKYFGQVSGQAAKHTAVSGPAAPGK